MGDDPIPACGLSGHSGHLSREEVVNEGAPAQQALTFVQEGGGIRSLLHESREEDVYCPKS